MRYFVPAVSALVATAALSIAPSLVGAAAPESVASVMTRHRVEEAATTARSNPLWRAPPKVLLLAFGTQGWAERHSAFQAAAPGANVVAARDLQSAIAAAADADVIIGYNPDICNPKLLDSAKQLRWLASLAAGVENCMALPAVRKPNLLVTNMRGMDSPAIAEHAVAMMMALAHGLDAFAMETANEVWSREGSARIRMQMLTGKTLLVVGLGGIGTEIAWRGKGLGMEVVATRDGGSGKPDFVSYIGKPDELLALAKTADVVVSAVPLTPQTRGMYDAKFFAVMKPNALFINIARGASVVTDDLVKALNERRIAGAGLDVTDPEPLPPGHPLWKAPRVLISPHISSRNDLPGEGRWVIATENLRRYMAGEKMLQVVDVARGD